MCDIEFPTLWEIMYFERGEVIARMRCKRTREFVTSDEMTLREFCGAILLFRNENQYFFYIFNQNYSEKDFEYVINRL